VFPPGRYGRRRSPRPRRTWLLVLVAALIGAAAVGLTVRLYRQYGNPDHSGDITAVTERTADRITVRYEVRNRPGTGPATCHLRALDDSGGIVGEADFAVAAHRRVTGAFTLPVTSRPTRVELVRCVGAPAPPPSSR
jgi:hypothetical protein